jgi:hypothetical protein
MTLHVIYSKLSLGKVDDFRERRVSAGQNEIQVDIVLERSATADRVGLGRGDLADGKREDPVESHKGIERRERVREKCQLHIVNEDGKLFRVVDQKRERSRRPENGLDLRQQSSFDRAIGEEVEVDGNAVTELKREARSASEIEVIETAEEAEELPSPFSENFAVHS